MQSQRDTPSQTILALHGFLGHPSDWDCFKELDLPLKPIDLSQSKSISLKAFAKEFNSNLQGSENILLGYSMGGRLALHCLLHSPDKYKAAIIVSGGPGLIAQEEKALRIQSDLKLLKRFETEDFDNLIQEWNTQALFNQNIPCKPKDKSTFLNHSLCQGLTSWSLGTQENLREAISKLPMPILWVVGEQDIKYRNLTAPLKFLNSQSRVWIAENAFHRVPWEVKIEFQNQVNMFLTSLI